MSQFIYSVDLPVSKSTVHLKEMFFIDLKNLVKNITNDDNQIIASTFEEVLREHVIEDTSALTIIDKLYILLTIRLVCISPIIELVVKCPSTKKTFNAEFDIDHILSSLIDRQIPTLEKTYLNDIKINFSLPKLFYIEQNRDILKSVINSITISDLKYDKVDDVITEKLPAMILNDVKQFLIDVNKFLEEIELFKILSPYDTNADPIIITANIFNNSIIEFLKLTFNRDLMSFYRLEYFLMSQFRMNYETLSRLTSAEVGIYTALYKEEQANREKAEKQTTSNDTPNLGNTQPGSGIQHSGA